MRRGKVFLIIGGTLVAILLIVEVVARIFFHETLTNAAMRPLAYKPDSVVNYLYIPNLDFEVNGNKFHINKQGFLGPDFPDKTKNQFRIIFMGDSFTAGSIASQDNAAFCFDLQEIFDQNDYRVEILNCGVDGAGRGYDNYKLIRYKVLDLEPDMLFLSYDLPLQSDNQVRELYKNYRMEYPQGRDSIRIKEMKIIDGLNRWKPLIDAFYPAYFTKVLFKLHYLYGADHGLTDYSLMYQTGYVRYKDSTVKTVFSMDESAEMIRGVQSELKAQQIPFFLYNLFPKPEAWQTARQYGLPLLDLKVELDKAVDYFPNDAHYNKSGSQKIAQRFFELMTKHHLIPPEYVPSDSIPTHRK